jgi:hypothetical protein
MVSTKSTTEQYRDGRMSFPQATPRGPKNLRKQIGSAVWLFAVLSHFTPAEWTGEGAAWIADCNAIADGELAERLGVSCATVASWRLKLRKFGLIGGWPLAVAAFSGSIPSSV